MPSKRSAVAARIPRAEISSPPPSSEHPVEAGERPGGGLAVAGRNLRRPPAPCVGRERGHGRRVHRVAVAGALHFGDPVTGVLARRQLGDAMVFRLRKSDEEIQPEGSGDLLGDETPGHPSVGPAQRFAHEVAVGHGVIDAAAARLPQRRHRGERVDVGIPSVHSLEVHRHVEAVEARPVRHDEVEVDRLLAVGGELRPDLGDRRGVGEVAALHRDGDRERQHALGRRPDIDQGIRLPGPGTCAASANPPHRSTTRRPPCTTARPQPRS